MSKVVTFNHPKTKKKKKTENIKTMQHRTLLLTIESADQGMCYFQIVLRAMILSVSNFTIFFIFHFLYLFLNVFKIILKFEKDKKIKHKFI